MGTPQRQYPHRLVTDSRIDPGDQCRLFGEIETVGHLLGCRIFAERTEGGIDARSDKQ